MLDLTVNSTWKRWEDEKPNPGEYFYVIGRYPGTEEYVTLAMQSTPMKHLYREMRYDSVDGIPTWVGYYPYRVWECADASHSFEAANEFQIEYWINVDDLLPTFIRDLVKSVIDINIWDDFDEEVQKETYIYVENSIPYAEQKEILEYLLPEFKKYNPRFQFKINCYNPYEKYPNLIGQGMDFKSRAEIRVSGVTYSDIETMADRMGKLNFKFKNSKINIYSES